MAIRCSIEIKSGTYDDKGQKTVRVKVRDISASGVGFISHEHFEVGMPMASRLPRQSGDWLHIKMTVRRCVKVASGLYIVGATFEPVASMFADGTTAAETSEANVI